MSLSVRLVLAFAGISVMVFAAVGFAAVRIAGDAVEQGLERRIEQTLETVDRNPRFFIFEASRRRRELEELAGISGFQIVVPDSTGKRVAGSSLAPEVAQRFLSRAPAKERFVTTLDGVSYRGARATVWGRPVYLLSRAAPIERAKAAARRPILIVSGVGLVAMIVLGALIAGSVTRPLRRLASQAIAAGSGDREVAMTGGGGREVEDLAHALSTMLEGLSRYRTELVRSERMAALGEFSAAAAHELRNPLSGMRMTVEMLAEKAGGEAKSELEFVLGEMARLDHSVEDLLFHAGAPRYRMADCDVREPVTEAVRTVRPLAAHLGVDLAVDVPERELRIVCDGSRIRQAATNLILNALFAASPEQSVEIRVSPGAGGGAVIEVTDSGEGIPESLGETIFEPFVSGREGGTGLGLSITRQIAAAHGGDVGYERKDERTVFSIRLPDEPPQEVA